VSAPDLELSHVCRNYQGLRPLRIATLAVAAGERVAIVGLDAVAAEVFVNLVTGATLPDQGEVRLFGRPTSDVRDSADWLALVDRFGIVSPRAVLLDQLSVVQNLAMPFTLDIEPPAADVEARAIGIAEAVGLAEAAWRRPAGDLDAAGRARLRLGRALALDPAILLLDHASADIAPAHVTPFGKTIREAALRRRAAVVALTADVMFAAAVAERVLVLQPATGELRPHRRGWFQRSVD
jgi:ABC-type transporter Mla maintaining outer membrane lipid asymmetry ATPase subunit MlaF